MKTTSLSHLSRLLALGCGLALPSTYAQPEPPPAPPAPPAEHRERGDRIERVETRTTVVETKGRPDDPRRLRPDQAPGRRGPGQPPEARPENPRRPDLDSPPQPEFRELRRNRAQLTDKLERMRAAGASPEDIGTVKERIATIDRRAAELGGARREKTPGRPQAGPEGRPEGRREPGRNPDAERRLQHLGVAIDNLHAAGLHEPAERLAQHREELARQMRTDAAGQPNPAAFAEIRRLRAELEEVRGAVQALKNRIEELHRGDH